MARQKVTDRDIVSAKEKYKLLSRKEKISYIWEYYRVHIIGTIVGIALLGSLVNSIFINPPKKSGLSVTFIDAVIDENVLDKQTDWLTSVLIDNPKKYAVVSDAYILQTDDAQMGNLTMQKIMAQLTAKEFDVFICLDQTFKGYAYASVLADLTQIPNFPIDKYEKVMSNTESDSTLKAYGIKIPQCKFFTDLGLDTTNYVLSVVVNGNHSDKAAKFLEAVYSYTGDELGKDVKD